MDPEIELESEMRDTLKVKMHFYEIGMKKYSQKILYCWRTNIWSKGQFAYLWNAITIVHWNLKWDILLSNDSTRNEVMAKCWVLSVRNTCDVSDDVISGQARIGACNMLSVFPCIELVLNGSVRSKPEQGPQMIVFSTLLNKHGICGWAAT